MSIEVLTNGCGVDKEYVQYNAESWKQNPGITNTITLKTSLYPDVITMIFFTVQIKQTETSYYTQPISFSSCDTSGYSIGYSHNTQGYLYASDYTDTSGIMAGQATIRFDKSGSTLSATISNIKYANGEIIYMPSKTVYAANYRLYLYGYNNI